MPAIINLRSACIYLELQAEDALLAVAGENDLGGQAGDGDIISSIDVGEYGVFALHIRSAICPPTNGMECTHRGNLVGELDGLGNGQYSLLDGALEVDVPNLLAQVRLRADKANQAVLDLQQDIGALLDILLDGTGGLDDELLATESTC